MAVGAAIGSTVIGGVISSSSASKAAKAQTQAADTAAQAQLDMFYQSREDMAPWTKAGAGAINALWGTPGTPEQTIQGAPIYGGGQGANALPQQYYVQLGGEGGPTVVENPAYAAAIASGAGQPQITGYQPSTTIPATQGTTGLIQQGPGEFKESPSYQFVLEEGQKGIQRAASATGRLGSGAYLKDATRYAEGLASTEYDNFLERYYKSLDPYFRLAGLGSNVAMASGQQSTGVGNTLAQIALQKGQAQAAGNLGAAYPWTQLANYGANQLGQYATNQYYNNQMGNANALNQYWQSANYTPTQMNTMGWL